MSKALGLIETRGLVAAIEAADAMLKTSNVRLIGKEIVKPALVTIKIVGDVAAVKASVDAGAAAAKKVGIVVSTHIIPQPDSQMESLIPEIKDDELKKEKQTELPRRSEAEKIQKSIKQAEIAPPTKSKEPEPEKKLIAETKKTSMDENAIKTDHLERLRMEALGMKSEKIKQKETRASADTKGPSPDLENMNVHQLRNLARKTKGFPIQGREISKANRQELLSYFKKIS